MKILGWPERDFAGGYFNGRPLRGRRIGHSVHAAHAANRAEF
jgi:hypothetical protein